MQRFSPFRAQSATLFATLFFTILVTLSVLPAYGQGERQEASDGLPSQISRPQPPRLALDSQKPVDLEFREETSLFDIYRALGTAFDLQVLFDPKLRDRQVTLHLEQVTAEDALEFMNQNFGVFHKALDGRTFLVADDTPSNRREYEDQLIRTFYLDNSEIRDAMTILRSLLGLKHVAADETKNSLMVRDTVQVVAAAAELLETVDRPRAELEIIVELLEVDRATLDSLSGPEGGTGPPLRLDAATRQRLTENAHPLARPHLGALDGKKARMRLTDRLPVGGEDGGAPYVEVGWELTVHPAIHSFSREITLELGLTVSGLGGPLEEGRRPVVSSRELQTSVRLSEGESCLISGLLGQGDSFGQLSQLPRPKPGKEIVVLLTPRIVRGVGYTKTDLQPLWVGTEVEVRVPAKPAPSEEEREVLRERLRQKLRSRAQAGGG